MNFCFAITQSICAAVIVLDSLDSAINSDLFSLLKFNNQVILSKVMVFTYLVKISQITKYMLEFSQKFNPNSAKGQNYTFKEMIMNLIKKCVVVLTETDLGCHKISFSHILEKINLFDVYLPLCGRVRAYLFCLMNLKM